MNIVALTHRELGLLLDSIAIAGGVAMKLPEDETLNANIAAAIAEGDNGAYASLISKLDPKGWDTAGKIADQVSAKRGADAE